MLRLTCCIVLLILTLACKSTPPETGESIEHALRVSVTTAPAEPRMDKPFTVRVQLLDASGGPVAGAKINGVLTMKDMDHGNQEFEFTEKGQGVYEGISKVEMSGTWNLKLSAEHGGDRMQQDISIQVGD